jgi:hypothetical protein
MQAARVEPASSGVRKTRNPTECRISFLRKDLRLLHLHDAARVTLSWRGCLAARGFPVINP